MYAAGDGTNHYPGTDTLWADKGNAMYDWICNRRGYFKDITLNDESKGDLLEVCFNLHYMHVVLGVDLPQLFKFDCIYMTNWCFQWAMFLRDIHVSSMSGIADIKDPHPNGREFKKPARLETVCKYYALTSKLEVNEQIHALEGKRTHEAWVTLPGGCMYCGNPISKNTKHWTSIFKATSAIWTHLVTCDKSTHCSGFEDIDQFNHYPVLIEARLSKEGLLSFESILEESLVYCMESVMNSRVKCFESLVENWGLKSIQATEGFKVYSAEDAGMIPSVTTFNVPLLESIASGHIFDRTFASPFEDIESVRKDNNRCMELLKEWLNQFSKGFSNSNLKVRCNGEGLTSEFLSKPRTGELGPGKFTRHPDLHPTSYQLNDPNDIRLILPVKRFLPMGCAKGVVGDGMIHPNLINAAVLQCHGMTAINGHFDAMSLAPNFNLLLTQGQATEVCSSTTASHSRKYEVSAGLHQSYAANSCLNDTYV